MEPIHIPIPTPPTLDVQRCAKKGEYVIVNYAFSRQFGACVGSGPFVRLSEAEMRTKGLTLVVDSLAGFATRKEEPSDSQAMPPVERRQFDREHSLVSVRQPSSDVLQLLPTERQRGGWRGRKDQAIVVELPTSSEEFYQALMEAFARSDE